MNEHSPEEEQFPVKTGSNLAGIIIVAVLVIAVGWLAHVLYKNLQLQKCELEGRHDCTDIPQPDQ